VAGCGLGVVASGCAAPAEDALAGAVAAARADAARRSGRDAAAFVLESADAVTWRDGSLGCPRPGMMYTQALVPGYRVRLRLADERFDYHGDRRGRVELCPPGQGVDPVADERMR
jgi:hypothetical protein